MLAAELARSPLLHDSCTLGIATHGSGVPLAAASHLPQAHLLKGVLGKDIFGGDAQVAEVWCGRSEATDATVGTTRCRHNGEVLFATVSAAVPDDGIDALGAATYAAYRSLLDALHVSGYPHLLRAWNSIPGINVDDGGLERYRRFNLHRSKAYSEAKCPTETGAPAACALGSFGGPLVVYCLASKAPAEPIENPRQTSAYRYPQQYGPRAPSFSRAALWRGVSGESDVLFISGTASIVGHQTQHQGDVVAQTHETLNNLESIVTQATRHNAQGISSLLDLRLKVYVRYPADTSAVRRTLVERGVDADAALYLHADICRADLLMEIEAFGPARSLQIRTEMSDERDSRIHQSHRPRVGAVGSQ